jgi:O-antigen ligase
VITLVPGTSDYNAAANQNQKAFNLPARYVTAHDLYLDVLTETGLLGLIPFILYLFYIGKSLWLSARRTNSQYLMASLLMFFWILGYSFFDGTLINDRVLLYFLIMVGIAAATIKEYKHA